MRTAHQRITFHLVVIVCNVLCTHFQCYMLNFCWLIYPNRKEYIFCILPQAFLAIEIVLVWF